MQRAGAQQDLVVLAAFESCRVQPTDEGQRRGDPLLQGGKCLVAALTGRDFRARSKGT